MRYCNTTFSSRIKQIHPKVSRGNYNSLYSATFICFSTTQLGRTQYQNNGIKTSAINTNITYHLRSLLFPSLPYFVNNSDRTLSSSRNKINTVVLKHEIAEECLLKLAIQSDVVTRERGDLPNGHFVLSFDFNAGRVMN